MDLSANISFQVQADITDVAAPFFILTDNSVYPVGVTVIGIFTITQPDTLTRKGKFTSPDISGNTTANIALRLDADNLLQPGGYVIKYEIQAVGYDNTVLSRAFTLNYTKPKAVIEKQFDLYTPTLGYKDVTAYSKPGHTYAVTRTWGANIVSIGTLSGPDAAIFDLVFGSGYYDAQYEIAFAAHVNYQVTAYPYLSILDLVTAAETADAYAPPTTAEMLDMVTGLKTKLDLIRSRCGKYDKAKADYDYAYTLYAHANKRICAGSSYGVSAYIDELTAIANNGVVGTQTHTNAPIAAYVYDCGGGGGATGTVFIVAETAGQPSAIAAGIIVGATTFDHQDLAGRYVQIFKNGQPLPRKNPLNGGEFFTKVFGGTTVTFSQAIQDGDYIELNTI